MRMGLLGQADWACALTPVAARPAAPTAFTAPAPARAHPHMFLDTSLQVMLDASLRVASVQITWVYDDGNGNTSTQAQSVVVADTVLEKLTPEFTVVNGVPPTATSYQLITDPVVVAFKLLDAPDNTTEGVAVTTGSEGDAETPIIF